jgi:tRNA-specific 2-thiouridylase
MKEKVCVGMSGGVDSSMAAYLLKEQDFDVCGITMNVMGAGDDTLGARAVDDARKVANFLGIEHHGVNAAEKFRENIVADFFDEYRAGRTPNPCVRCNRFMKFGYLMKMAEEQGCRYFATGHYARIENRVLRRGLDIHKDQSYFLYVLYGSAIERILFPLGSMHKKDVREAAFKAGLPSHSRSESQDICFIPDNNHIGFLETVIPSHSGPILDVNGIQIGTHNGVHRYTIGQRKGLGPLGRAMFVKEIRPESNTIVAVDEPNLMSTTIALGDVIAGPMNIAAEEKFDVQIRYRTPPSPAKIRDFNGARMVIEFDSPVRAVAPGQAAVLYNGDTVVAGGTIESIVN